MRTALRLTLAAGIGTAAVALSVASVRSELPRAEAAALPSFDPLFPTFDRAAIYPMGEAMRLGGVPLRLGYFTAKATPQQVVDYYSAFWRRQSLVVTGDGDAKSSHASGFDGVTGVVHSISAMAQGDRVLAFCSVTSIQGMGKPDAREGLIPIPERARFVERTAAGEGEGGQLSVTYLIDGTRAGHETELKQLFAGKGWSPVPERTRTTAAGESLEFKRGGQVLFAALFEDLATHTVGVQLHAAPSLESSP
jgi:hypothetical protein